MNRIVVCVNAPSYAEAVDQVRGADCAELRLDLLDLSRNELGQLYLLCKDWIITPRKAYFKKDPDLLLLKDLLQKKPLYLDIDEDLEDRAKKVLYQLARENEVPVLASFHNYTMMPKLEDLKKVYEGMKEMGAQAFKFAIQAQSTSDILRMQDLWQWDERMLVFSMGPSHTYTRVNALFLGLKMMYVKTTGQGVAPGQLTRTEAEMLLKVIKR